MLLRDKLSPSQVALQGNIEVWRNDPCEFFVDVLGVDRRHIWPKMRDIAESVRDNRFTVVPAGHSVSKSYTAGRLVVWFMMSFPPCTVITTAPNDNQVRNILWREIRDSVTNSRLDLGGRLLTQGWDFQDETGQKWFALGFATKPDTVTREATAFQGYHNKNVFIVFDEAAGIPKEIWDAAQSLFTDENVRFLAIGNPTSMIGEFAEVVKDPKYHVINISVKDTPNFIHGYKVGDPNHIPGVAGRELEEMYRDKYGLDHREYKIRILGEFAGYGVSGSYYGPILRNLEKKGRFDVQFHPSYPVHTVFDNGYTTAIWFFQIIGQKVNFIRYYQDSGPGIEEYIDLLERYKHDIHYRYGSHFAPFDIDNNSQRAVTGSTILETADDLGFVFTPLPRELNVLDGIQRTKKFLQSCWFNKNDCSIGLELAGDYHERRNIRMEKANMPYFTGVPAKDGSDHAADGLRYASMAVSGNYINPNRMTKEKWRELKAEYGYS